MMLSLALLLAPSFAQTNDPVVPPLIAAAVQGQTAGPSGPRNVVKHANADTAGPSGPANLGAENVLRMYDLRSIQAGRSWETVSRSLLPAVRIDQGGLNEAEEYEPVFSPDEVMELLYRRFDEEIEYEGRGMWGLEDGRLALRAPESVHAGVVRTLSALDALTSAHVELTVDVLVSRSKPLGDPEVSGLVPLARAEAWLMNGAAATERERYAVKLATGRTTTMDALRSMPVVLDWDVEIAQGAAVHDPATTVLSLGRRLQLAGAPSADGLMLSYTLLQSELALPPVTRSNRQRALLGSEAGHDFVDAPSNTQFVQTWDRTLACNSTLRDGQALVLRFDLAGTDGDNYHEAIVIRRTGGELPLLRELPSWNGRGWTAIDGSALNPPRLSLRSESDRLVSEWFDLIALGVRDDYPLRAVIRCDGADMLYELLESGRHDSDDVNVIGSWMLASPVRQAEVEEEFEKPVPSYEQIVSSGMPSSESVNVELELRRGGPQGEVLRRAGLALRNSDSNLIALGVERSYEYSYDVEVAQHAGVGDPETRISFDGLLCKLGLSAQPDGGLRIDVEAHATALEEEKRFEYAGLFLERAQQPVFARLELNDSLHLAKGETERRFVLGNQFEGRGSRGMTLVVHVTR
ncbi:MAG: hypothetical protein H6831_02515 [Planctomycetes bacterium]|nr:hypothetical protein [Planctomycetota bacterium]MCB9903256.1 hypothetical protein [Planctomycetota bacterium]